MRQIKEDVRKEIKVHQPQVSSVVSFVPIKHNPIKNKVMRPGKTARDHESGAHQRHIQNQIDKAIKQQNK